MSKVTDEKWNLRALRAQVSGQGWEKGETETDEVRQDTSVLALENKSFSFDTSSSKQRVGRSQVSSFQASGLRQVSLACLQRYTAYAIH